MSTRTKLGIFLMLLVAFLLFPVLRVYIWDGGFPQVEYRLTFLDREGRPIQGIELTVEDQSGNEYLYYPVSDLTRTAPPASDPAGELVFHHARVSGIEFGGRCTDLWLFRFGTCDPPRYDCRFVREGKEVFRCNFTEMHRALYAATSSPEEVTRTWDWKAYYDERFGGKDTDTVQSRFARTNQERETATTRQCSTWLVALNRALHRRDSVGSDDVPSIEELTFRIYRRTIVLD